MPEANDSQQPDWTENTGFAENTTRVLMQVDRTHKETWKEKAEEQDTSLSSYLYELIQEARAYCDEGFLAYHQSDERIEKLEAQVAAWNRS